jgi:co-chaperonin GroES (HSP10)
VHNLTVISKHIVVPDTVATGQAQLFQVAAASPGRWLDGSLISPDFAAGDYVIATRRVGQVIEFGAENKVIMMPDEAILAVCEKR